MKLTTRHIIFLLTVFTTQFIASQTFKATVSKNTLGLNERLQIQFSINKQGVDDFTPPNFKNFKVVAGPFQSTNFQYINGKQSFEKSFSYTLQPVTKGKFTIPSATATYKGKTIKSNPIQITVSNKINKPKDANDPSFVAKDNIFLVAEISNTKPFVGESISVVYKLYMDRNKAGVSNERETKSPTYNGFWNQNIKITQLTERKGKFKGKDMSYYILRKDVLIPQRSGKLNISPLEIDITAVVASNQIRTDFFGRRIRGKKQVSLTLSTGNRTVAVKALPLENKPANFSGAVGTYAFKVTNSKNVLKVNESTQVKVLVSGTGNIKLISLPTIETPKGLELYDPEHKENVKIRLRGMSGSVSNTYTIVPQYRGKYKIPPLSFSFFNPKTKAYKTLQSAPIIINVPEGKLPEEEKKNSVITDDVREINDTDIRFIHTKTSFSSVGKKEDFFTSNLFYILLLLPVLSIPLGIYLGKQKEKRNGDVAGNKKRKADRLAKKYLSAAKKQLGNKEPFYVALEKALHNYLKAKLQVETSEISKDKISVILKERKVDDTIIQQFIKVLDDCDFARYTPMSNLQMEKEYQNAAQVIASLDKQL